MEGLDVPVGACVLADEVVVVRPTPSGKGLPGWQRHPQGHAAAGTVARAAGRANVSSISISRAPTIRLTLHARALR